MPFIKSLNYFVACWSHVTKWNVLCSTHSNTEVVIYFKWHSKPFHIRLRTPYTNIYFFWGRALGLRYVQIHSAAWCYHSCGHVIMLFQIVYYFLLVGNGDTIMSRSSVVTWTRHFFHFHSLLLPAWRWWWCFAFRGGFAPTWFRSWIGSAISFDWRWNLGKT